MKVIGLTGNLGCGKSTVAGILRQRGVAIIDLDAVAREVRNNDAEARRRIEQRFGTLEAGALARIVFSDRSALAELEAIVHPLVRNAARARLAELEAGGVEVAVIEAIKLIESPLHDACDQVWVVRCNEEEAIARLVRNRGWSADDARSRIANQSPQAVKVAAADVVLDGSADLDETRRQAEEALGALLAKPEIGLD